VGLAKFTPVAEGIILVVDIESPIERHEVGSLEHNLGVSSHGTVIWHNLGDLWLVVVPVAEGLEGVLLSIQRYREWHWSLNNVREGSSAPDWA
jgi:hypothetical protein